MKTTITGILILCVMGMGTTAAQSFKTDVSKRGTTAAAFLSISQGARAASMGSAFVAVADDWGSLYWNPAGIATLGNGVTFDHTMWIADLGYNYIAGSANLGSFGAIGLSLTSSSMNDMRVTTVDQPDGTGEVFKVTDMEFSVAYAIQLTENFSIGFNPKVVYERIWKMSASALAIDAGIKYRTPFEGITLGMAISNFGEKLHIAGENATVLYDTDPSNTGNNGRIPAEVTTSNWSLPLIFRVGIAYTPNLGEMHKVTIALDALHPSDDYESINVGGEYVFDGILALRGGYKALGLKDSEESYTFGVGVKQRLLGNITISADYAYMDFSRLNNAQKFSISIGF
jgi:hypothetical protein